MMVVDRPSILFIDAYDSFTNNIISLLTTTLSCSVRVIRIDSPGFGTDEELCNELWHYDAVICGPGPGDPSNQKDVGYMSRIWRLNDGCLLPVLGICLGFQSLCLAFGGQMRILTEGLHGRVRRIHHVGEFDQKDKDHECTEIFDGVGVLKVTLYHSLYVGTNQNDMDEEQWEEKKWEPINSSGHLFPLAWADNKSKDRTRWKDDRILMAVRHETKPFWGLQYHPESICSNEEAKTVIKNWFMLAQRWNRANGRKPMRDGNGIRGELPTLRSLLSNVEQRKGRRSSRIDSQRSVDCHYDFRVLDLPDHISVPDIIEKIQGTQRDQIILESSNAHIHGVGAAAVRGRYSIIGLDVDDALRIDYHAKDKWARAYGSCLNCRPVGLEDMVNLEPFGGIWPLLADFLEKRRIMNGNDKLPFWGGFMGYTTYELGLEGIGVNTIGDRVRNRPDLCFAWITKSLVIDHLEKKIFVQQLIRKELRGFDMWLDEIVSILQPLLKISNLQTRRRNSKAEIDVYGVKAVKPSVTLPNNRTYESKVRECQEQIRKGESYELCLTDQTEVSLLRVNPFQRHKLQVDEQLNKTLQTTAWSLYRSLRVRQPAPFASFIRLGAATFVSSSPERFLKWNSSGKCELRPMKGTVKKTPIISTLTQAEALLQTPKEQAENLMIVDLVRHDLHGVCGSGNVTVPRLMVVEEYASVFQMISVVEGQIPQNMKDKEGGIPGEIERKTGASHTGIDVLAASLPPGSMTGAPKKRSCEILQEIEGYRDRSLYSGVVGYMDVGGRGEFSVNIRCMYSWDDEGPKTGDENIKLSSENQDSEFDDYKGQDIEIWHIGAGGAVTALSSPDAEREEMQTKLSGTLAIFGKGSEN